MDDLFLIGSFSVITNVSKRMLRHYDQMNLLSPFMCDEQTGYRYYSEDQIKKVHLIQRLQQHGLSLKTIRSILEREVTLEAFLEILKNQEALLRNSMDDSLSQLIVIRESLSQLSCVSANNQMMDDKEEASFLLDLKDTKIRLNHEIKEGNNQMDKSEVINKRSNTLDTLYDTKKYEVTDYKQLLKSLHDFSAFYEGMEERIMDEQTQQVYFLIFDIDNFMKVNDRYGFKTGDRVIYQLYDSVRKAFDFILSSGEGLIGRHGGDEFNIFAVNTEPDKIVSAMEQAIQAFAQFSLEPEVFFTSSCGGIVVEADKIKEIRDQVKTELIDIENVSQHLRHESTKVLLEVKRTEHGQGRIKQL